MEVRSWKWAPILLAGIMGATSCARRPPMIVQPLAASCHQVAPDALSPVTRVAPNDRRDLRRLSDWCRTVGPMLVESPTGWAAPSAVERLAIVTWNVHVGGGDAESVVARLRRGEFTDGQVVTDFVLLLQEVFREGSEVPREIPAGLPMPRSIVTQPPTGARRDIRQLARQAGLHVFYAPAMRNGGTKAAEDRGTAILSTLPLADLQVIELPFERQRRVALAATVAGHTTSGVTWRLRLAGVHVDTSLALTRGGPFQARRRQAEALVEALSAGRDLPTVVGGDFNTWLGPREPALDVMRQAFPDTPVQTDTGTWRGPLGTRAALDYVFVRGQFESVSTRKLPERFGSDHHPLLTLIEF